MKKFENIMIASDLDGTFLATGSKEVKRNIEAIEYFIENGGTFTFSTGRIGLHVLTALPNSRKYVNCPAVTCNGMSLHDLSSGQAVKKITADTDLICDTVDLLFESYPNIAYRGITDKGVISFQPENPFIKREAEFRSIPVIIVEREDWRKEEFFKLTLRDTHEMLCLAKDIIEKNFPHKYNICFSESDLLEVQPFGISKAVTLMELREKVSEGKELKRLYAVGDYENDLEMLQCADVAVCPSNAIDSVKEICDLCLCDNNTGVIADLIEYLDRTEL